MGKFKPSSEKCSVKTSWFDKLDDDGKPLGTYFKRVVGSTTHVLCVICNKKLNCELKGVQAITQHHKYAKHVKALRSYKSQLQLTAATKTTVNINNNPTFSQPLIIPDSISAKTTNVSQEGFTLKLTDPRNEATAAEIIWTMKVVSSNYSDRSCEDIGITLQRMFPNNSTCSEFSLGRHKVSYMQTDCVATHLRDIFLLDVKDCRYTLCYDETPNAASKNELQTSVRYYSEKKKRILHHHLETFFMENGRGKTIVKYLDIALRNANLPIEHMLTLSRDGPNVNKTVFTSMMEKYKQITGKKLIDTGTCDIHIVHNGFKKGLDEFGDHVSDLMVNVHFFFDGEALRSQEYRDIKTKMGLRHHRFIKHVPSRWLTLLDSVTRFIQQWEPVNEYFLSFVPKKRASAMNSVTYKNIVRHLKSATLKGKHKFLL